MCEDAAPRKTPMDVRGEGQESAYAPPPLESNKKIL